MADSATLSSGSSKLAKPTLLELSSPLSPQTVLALPSREEVQSSKEYKSLQIQYNRILRLYTDVQNQNQKKIDDLIEYYEEKLAILETRLKRDEKITRLNESVGKRGGANEEQTRTINCQCDLLYDLGVDGLANGPNSTKLRQDFDTLVYEQMKKLENERLEVDIRRIELRNKIQELDKSLENSKNVKTSYKNVFFTKEPVKVKNEQLNKLLNDCDEKIVDLSKIFLNEKIDLMFQHNKSTETLKKQLVEMEKLNKAKLTHIDQLERDLKQLEQEKLNEKVSISTQKESNKQYNDIIIHVQKETSNDFTQTDVEFQKLKIEKSYASAEVQTEFENQSIKQNDYKIFNDFKVERFSQTESRQSVESTTQTDIFSDFMLPKKNFKLNQTQPEFDKTNFSKSLFSNETQTEQGIFIPLKKSNKIQNLPKSYQEVSAQTDFLNGLNVYTQTDLEQDSHEINLNHFDSKSVMRIVRLPAENFFLNEFNGDKFQIALKKHEFKSTTNDLDVLRMNELLFLEKKVNSLNADNKHLNQIIIELKIIIAKMYEKLCNFSV